jgi:hypothetical protein
MRSLSLLALCALSGLVPSAWAAPTIEEQALRAALDGRSGDAVRLLDGDDATLRWTAGRHALLARDYNAAARLFSGQALRDVWGRIDLAAVRGDLANASALALAQMDLALAGAHRDALGKLLVGWAGERAALDPDGAAQFLLAAMGLVPSPAVRKEAEDALFRLPPHLSAGEPEKAARRRLEEEPGNVPARLRVAMGLAKSRPGAAAGWLVRLTVEAERADAIAAATHLVGLDVPDPLVLDALAALGARFPEDPAIPKLRLDHAIEVAGRDPDLGVATLALLEPIPSVALEAREARAAATPDPTKRRALWMAIAAREGASARGDAARQAAYQALVEGVYAEKEGPERTAAAVSALQTPDGAGTAALLHLAIADGAGRTDALWALAARFPDGAWCDELGDRLVAAGSNRDEALRFTTVCTAPSGVGASALYGHAVGTPRLHLGPRAGGLDVTASAADVLRVSQHRVDPEALFRATDGHPLDATLDAFLLDPDLTWDVPQPDGILKTVPVSPRGGGPLTALTIRAGDQRATALVVADRLDVQVIRRGADVALAVLRGSAPVGGADLLLLDSAGVTHRARTDGTGVVVLRSLPDALRVMARKGNALGFATASAGEAAEVVTDTWSVVPWDRAVPVEGAVIDVSVFGSRPSGPSGAGKLRLQSRNDDRNVIEEVPVTLVNGAARARLFVMGRGSVTLVSGDTELARALVKEPYDDRPLVRITWTPANPRPGARVEARIVPVEPLGPNGLAGELTVTTGWSTNTTPLVLGPEGATFSVDLTSADDPTDVAAAFRLPDGRGWASGVPVSSPYLPDALAGVPAVVGAGASFKVGVPDGGWLLATSDAGTSRWARAGAPIVLPTAGTWSLCAWVDRCGPATPVVVADGAIDAAGRWTGAPILSAVTAEGIRSARIVRTGDSLLVGNADGTRRAWVHVADDAVGVIPLRGTEPPPIAVTGTLARGGTSTLHVGTALPEGTRIWAFLRDAANGRRASAAKVAPPWDGTAGTVGDAWTPEARWGEAIAAALLEEEERLAEVTNMERVDFGFSAAAEVGASMGFGGMGASGYGSGGGGYGSSDYGNGIILGGLDRTALLGDPHALGVLEAAAPGPMRFEVPTWIAAADLELVARLPDGRWTSRMVRLDVGGAPLTAMPAPAAYVAPEAWDGAAASLLPLARSLPVDARTHALAALAKAGVPGAEPALHAAWTLDPSGPSAVLARTLTGKGAGAIRGTDLDAIPDLRRADRAVAALSLAATDPDRARAAAARLLRTADLEPWARARAGLALHVAGAPEDARAALVGDAPVVAAARAVVLGKADIRFAAAWWATARAEAAQPADRALAVHALTLLPPTKSGFGSFPSPVASKTPLLVAVEAPLATWRGETFPRGRFIEGTVATGPLASLAATSAPAGRVVPLWIQVPAFGLPTRLVCPDARFVDLAPAAEARTVGCTVTSADGGEDLHVRWFSPDGAALADGRARLTVEPARDSAATDAMSPRERLLLGLRLSASADPAGPALLEGVLATEALPAADLERASIAILAARRTGGEPKALIEAFQAYREHVPQGALGLETASALAHAYALTGDPKRAYAATRVVMDARFKEELGAVSQLQDAGLGLTALKLLRELVDRYPEVPTVVSARYLAPSMLLGRAEGDGDRLGYTRSSLRHTAAAELATFLLLHPDAPQAPEAAALLVDALHALDDPARERALAGPLARRYRDGAAAWRLSLADARATLTAGRAAEAFRILAALDAPPEGAPEVDLERGRALEALGRLDEARAAYDASGTEEATERRAWLDREELALPTVLVLTPGIPARVEAHLRPGAEVTVTAIRVLLEAALLRDAGALDATSLSVAGLKPTASRTVTVGIDGDVLLPVLPEGAYVVTVTAGATAGRMVVVRTDAELVVDSRAGSGTLVHLTDTSGRPLADAQLWLFGAGTATTARTDGRGAAFVPYGGGALGVLAKLGDRYALANLGDDALNVAPQPSPAYPTEGYGDVLRKNEAAYDQLFQQDARQVIEANAL